MRTLSVFLSALLSACGSEVTTVIIDGQMVSYAAGRGRVVDTTAPTVPQNLAAIVEEGHIELSWSKSTDDISGRLAYEVFRDASHLANVSNVQYADLAVVLGATYSYQVLAVDKAGNRSALSPAVSITLGGGPLAPTCSLTANPGSIQAGGLSTLTLVATGSYTTVTLNSEAVALVDDVHEEIVSPSQSTTYVAVITGDGGSSSCTATVTVLGSPDPTGTFDCFAAAAEVVPVTGLHVEKFDPDPSAGRAFDARTADFVVRESHGTISVEGDAAKTGMCWAGGYVYSEKPWDASWDDHKDPDGPTRNSAAISNSAYGMTITGLHYFNVHDGARTNNAYSWQVQHSWGEYVRDDCVENDQLHSGRVYDVLFDGCYTGISTEASAGDPVQGGQLVELDRLLLRMQPMPYPYEWQEKSGIIGVDGEPYDGTGIPYGHGDIFKLDDDDISRNPHFAVRNSVFLVTHHTQDSKTNFPPASLVDACENNTIIWLGGGAYPGELPTSKFPGCFTLLTGQQGIDYWVARVTDWHARHPEVGAGRKPASPGSLEFPRQF